MGRGRCGSVFEPRNNAAILLTVRRSKTNQEGTAADVRYLKDAAAKAVLALQPADVDTTTRVFGGLTPQQLGRRFTAAAQAAGIAARLTAHSGRVGLASELTARGASTAAVMRAGAWKTARMVAHYSAGANAVLRQLDFQTGRSAGVPRTSPASRTCFEPFPQ